MALSSLSPPLTHISSTKLHLSFPCIVNPHPHSHNYTNLSPLNKKWQTNVSFFPSFFNKKTKDPTPIKQELLQAIEPLDRGADATPQDQQIIDQVLLHLIAIIQFRFSFLTDCVFLLVSQHNVIWLDCLQTWSLQSNKGAPQLNSA